MTETQFYTCVRRKIKAIDYRDKVVKSLLLDLTKPLKTVDDHRTQSLMIDRIAGEYVATYLSDDSEDEKFRVYNYIKNIFVKTRLEHDNSLYETISLKVCGKKCIHD